MLKKGTAPIPRQALRRLALAAQCDERTIRKVFADPGSQEQNMSRMRAFKILTEAGYLPKKSDKEPE